jgi:ankyrin repeat protein
VQWLTACNNRHLDSVSPETEQEELTEKIECNSIFHVIQNCTTEELKSWLQKDSIYANFRDTTAYRKTALMYAAETNDTTKFNLLLKFGADPYALVDRYIHPQFDMLYVVLKYDSDEILKEIIKHDLFDLNKRYNDCESAIYTCARNNSPKTLKLLIDNGAKIHVVDECERNIGYSPLCWAAMERSYNACKVLIDEGADVNRIEDNMHTVLGQTCFTYEDKGRLEIVQLLVDNGADVNKSNSLNFTPLMMSANRGNSGTVEFLIKNGAKINTVTSSGYTALHYAARNNHFEAIELLLKNGASSSIKDNNGKLAIDHILTQDLKDKFTALIE